MRQWNDTIYQLYRQAPGSFRVNQISGEILETQGRFAEAAAEYRKAIAKNSKHRLLAQRLLKALCAPVSQKRFEKLGFGWKAS